MKPGRDTGGLGRGLASILRAWTLPRGQRYSSCVSLSLKGSEEALTGTAAAGDGKREAKEAKPWPYFLLQPQHFNYLTSGF